MLPVKIFSIRRLWPRMPRRQDGSTAFDPAWLRDPLSHPDIEAMSATELADLPFRWAKAPAVTQACCAQD